MSAPAEVLPWDSEFFGVRIARAASAQLSPDIRDRLLKWCAAERIALLYFLADPLPDTIREAERAGFALMDVKIALSMPAAEMAKAPADDAVRPARPEDLAALRALTRQAHRDSRFFADGRIPEERAAELFARWLERDCAVGDSGYAAVVDDGAGAEGYVTGKITAPGVGQIGLLAVGERARGRGLGQALLGAAGRWFVARGVQEVRVVTQGRNLAAQRLYQRVGFRTASLQLWYHKWFSQ
jgi:dTDP-4-amino-4,6-dideoxy-D-galactose acyltransferase